MTPWEALGLTREEAADPAAVRRAYARQLKAHRPDRDPEGFRRVRDAYEALTGPMAAFLLRRPEPDEDEADDDADGDADSDADDDADEAEHDAIVTPPAQPAIAAADPAPTPPAVPAPAAVKTAPAPAKTAPAPPPPRDERGWEELAARCADAEADEGELAGAGRRLLGGTPAPATLARLAALLAERPAALLAALDDAQLLAAAAHGAGDALLTAAAHLEDAGERTRLAALAEAAAASPLIADDGMLLYGLAGFCALDHPKQARALAHAAFRSLPSQARHLLDRLELRIRLGGEMSRWPAPLRRTMIASLESGRLPEQREILRGRLAALPANSALRHAVARAFPKWRIGQPVRSRITSREEQKPGCTSGRLGMWVAWIFLVGLISRIANCASEPPRRAPVWQPQPPRLEQERIPRFQPIPIPPPPAPRTPAQPMPR